MAVDHQPAESHTVGPYLCVDGAAAAIDFYTDVFDASETYRIPAPDGKIGHAEVKIGDSLVMLSDEYPEMNVRGPKTIGGSPVTLTVFVPDVDATFAKALAAGATEVRPVEDQFYGDRAGQIEDPFGHRWSIHTHIEDVSPEEIDRRAAAMFGE
jgi:PhnB protein